MKKNILYSIAAFVVALFTACSSNIPKVPPPNIPIEVPLPPDQLKEILCINAKNAGEWSNWIIVPNTGMKYINFTGCTDNNGNDPRVRETAYLYSYKSPEYPKNKRVPLPEPKPGVCTSKSDFCGAPGTRQAGLNQTVCKKDPVTKIWSIESVIFDCATLNTATDKFTCREGKCVNMNTLLPDLTVTKISNPVTSLNCNSYVTFEICNNSENTVLRDFKIAVTVNMTPVELTYPASQNNIGPNQCVTVSDPQKLSILAFGLTLNQTAAVTVEANPLPHAFSEASYTNNTLSASVSTGANWMLNSAVKCETFCYDTDYSTALLSSKNPVVNGTLFSTETGGFAYKGTDFCLGEDNPQVVEFFCQPPTIVNGIATNLFAGHGIYCADVFAPQGLPGVCKDGNCVVADRYNTCIDTENGHSTAANGTVSYSTPRAAGAGGYNPNQSFPLTTVRDTCYNAQSVHEQYCDPSRASNHVSEIVPCDTPQTPGFVCDSAQGICVPGGSCSCVMKGPNGATLTSNLINRVETATRTCNGAVVNTGTDSCFPLDSTTLFQYRCDAGGFVQVDQINCDTVTPGWGCHEGICVPPNQALKQCIDSDLQGVSDPAHAGTIRQTDAFGNLRADKTEECDPDGIFLNEWYCAPDKTAKLNHFDCSSNGMVCRNGACVSP